MQPRRILTILGTRPEAIKLAPVILELQQRPQAFESRVCVTAQHRGMLDQALSIFDIQPDIDLDIMTPGQTLAKLTARAIERLDGVIAREAPDVVLVQGDTTTTFCGALAAYYQRTRVGHVEAGLRTGDKYAPFPEEINRSLVTQVSDLHFAPTAEARDRLLAAGVPPAHIHVTGNTVIDALFWVREHVASSSLEWPERLLDSLNGHRVVIVTGHRRESFGEDFNNICRAIREVAESFPDVAFVYPVHLNPNVRDPVTRILAGHARIHLIEPLPYAHFVHLMNRAVAVLTDSGGVQEEAPSLGKPVLVMRRTTERPEGITAGSAQLVGVEQAGIVNALSGLLQGERLGSGPVNPYGDGQAARRIVDVLADSGRR